MMARRWGPSAIRSGRMFASAIFRKVSSSVGSTDCFGQPLSDLSFQFLSTSRRNRNCKIISRSYIEVAAA
jgi:hypothetical protein